VLRAIAPNSATITIALIKCSAPHVVEGLPVARKLLDRVAIPPLPNSRSMV
jgi:hypothetical protein